MMYWRRILAEKRRMLLPLAVLAGANVLLYAVAMYPLSLKVAAAEARATAAMVRAARARQDLESARVTLESKTRAASEIERFYRDVLPADLAGARRISYRRMAQLAGELNLRFDRRVSAPEELRGSALVRLGTTMALVGDYRDIRLLIYRLETSPEFIVIDDIALDQGEELGLTMKVSTYYWTGRDGT